MAADSLGEMSVCAAGRFTATTTQHLPFSGINPIPLCIYMEQDTANIEAQGAFKVKGLVDERAIELGEYITENKATVRAAAVQFGISKSTVHKDVSQRLRRLNPQLYRSVKSVLEQNKAERHIRGGMATRKKYSHLG